MNGEDYPYRPLELSTTAGQKDSTDLLGYDRLLTALNSEQDELPIIQPEDWGEGKSCTLLVFNNVPNDRPNAPAHRNPPQLGNVRLEIKFSDATTENITVLVMSEKENVFEINPLGGVKYNLDH